MNFYEYFVGFINFEATRPYGLKKSHSCHPDSDYHILSLKKIGSQQNPTKSIKGKDSPDSDYYIFFLKKIGTRKTH